MLNMLDDPWLGYNNKKAYFAKNKIKLNLSIFPYIQKLTLVWFAIITKKENISVFWKRS